jgi:O-antigen ligase
MTHDLTRNTPVDWLSVGLIGASALLVAVSTTLFHVVHVFFGAILFLFAFRFDRRLFFLAAYAASVFVIYNEPGLDLKEFSYYFFTLLFVARVLLPDLLQLRIRLNSSLDKLFLALFILSLFHIVTGAIFGGDLFRSVREFTFYYSPLLFYVFIRDHTQSPGFWKGFVAISYGILGYTIFRSIYDYYLKLTRATQEWEFGVIRGAGNENVLLFGAFLSFFLFVYLTSKKVRAFHMMVFFLCAIGLLVTLTRSVWIGFAFGMGLAVLFGDGFARRKTITYLGTLISGLVLIAFLFFQDAVLFAWEIIQLRFRFLSSNTLDMSFVDRFYETQAVWEYIRRNPVLGYGHGVDYIRYDLFFGHTKNPSSFIHNGYLAVYFKFGLIGVVLFVTMFGWIIRNSLRLFHLTGTPWVKALSMAMFCYFSTALLINLVTPVFLFFEGIFLMTVLGGILSMLVIRESNPESV